MEIVAETASYYLLFCKPLFLKFALKRRCTEKLMDISRKFCYK